MSKALLYILGLLLFLQVFGHSSLAQNLLDRRELNRYERKIESYQNQFRRVARRDPANEGAKLLAQRLDTLQNVLRDYIAEKQTKQAVLAVLQASVREASRYSTPQAQKTVQLLADLANFLKTQPDLDYLANPPPSQNEPEPNPSARGSQQFDRPSVAKVPEQAAKTTQSDQVDTSRQTSTNQADEDIGLTALQSQEHEESLSWEMLALWIIIALLIGVVFWLFRSVKALRLKVDQDLKALHQQLLSIDFKQAGQAAANSSGDFLEVVRKDFNKRIDRLEQNTTEFLQLLESRINYLEGKNISSVSQLNKSFTDLPDFVLNNLENRIKELESRVYSASSKIGPIPTLLRLPGAPELEVIYEALAQIRRQSNLKPLIERSQWLTDQLRRAEHEQKPELIDLHLAAEVLQLAYVAAYNEQLDEPYESLVRAFQPLGLISEVTEPGEAPLPPDVAVNVPLHNYSKESRFQAEEFPNRPTVLRQLEKRWPNGAFPTGVLVQALQPTIWFEGQQNRILLAKGMFIIN